MFISYSLALLNAALRLSLKDLTELTNPAAGNRRQQGMCSPPSSKKEDDRGFFSQPASYHITGNPFPLFPNKL
jgi:hypothetical protein